MDDDKNRSFRAGTPSSLNKPHIALNYGVNAAGEWVPQAASSGASSGTATATSVNSVLAPQSMSVGAAPASLTVPAGANTASVHVISGAVRWSLGGAPSASTPLLSAGDSADLAGAELAAFRMVRDGGTDAQVYVAYGVVG